MKYINIKNKHQIFIMFLFVSMLIGVLLLAVTNCVYAIDDDLIMSMITSGIYGEEFSQCLIFSSSVLGWGIRFLNKILDGVNWYMLIQYMSLCVSSALLASIVYRKKLNLKISIVSFIWFWLFILCSIYEKITFTSTAGICSLIGLIGIIEFYNDSCLLSVISSVLALFGFMYRIESFLLVIPFWMLYLFFHLIDNGNKLSIYKNLIIYVSLIIVLIFCCKIVDFRTYRSDEWRNYLERNDVRSIIQDYNVNISVDDMKRSGISWSENDYRMFKALKIDNKYKFSLDNLRKLSKIAVKTHSDVRDIATGVKEFYLNTFSNIQIMIFFVTLIFTVFVSKKTFLRVAIVNLLGLLLTVLLIYNGRFPYRVSVIVWSAVNTIMFLELLETRITNNRTVLNILLILLLSLFGVQVINNDSYNDGYNLIETINKDTNHLYIIDVFAFGESNNMKPIDRIPPTYMNHFLISGGWMCQSPLTENVCSKHGANNTLDILGKREDVFYVMQEIDDVSIVEKYLQENYDKSIKCEIAEKLGGGYVSYKFVRQK